MANTQKMLFYRESVMEEIEEKLLTLSAPELSDICTVLGLAVDESYRDLPRRLRRIILQYLEGDEVTSLEDEGISVLLKLNNNIDELKHKNGDDASESGEMFLQHHPVGKGGTASSKIDNAEEKKSASSVTETAPAPKENLSVVHPLYRRDLKWDK